MAPPVEITIPTTSIATPSDGKPFTQYNITLHLPLRSYVVQKRYTDFTRLHTTLTSLVGQPPPQPLPPKHWLRSTVSSPDLTEDRRRHLESYLKSIAESPDRRWRDTPAWRAFLNLPALSAGSAASSSGVAAGGHHHIPAITPRDATAAAARDPRTWMDLHREMKALLADARQQLARRDTLDGTAAVEAGAEAKRRLVLASNRLRAMEDGLREMADTRKLGEGELRRRRDVVNAAKGERDGLEKLSASIAGAAVARAAASAGYPDGPGASISGDKAMLLARSGTGSSARRVLGAPLPETERTRELDNAGVLQLQQQQMAEQDQDVEVLTKIVRRQKEMGLAIQDEVDRQIDYLNELNTNVDRVQGKLEVAKKKEQKLRM